MPTTSRAFLKAAAQRLATAEFLLKNDYTLDAMYLAGYCVECALKALILERTRDDEKTERLRSLSAGASMHNPESLAGKLKELGSPVDRQLLKRLIRSGWSTSLRYEVRRRDTGETKGYLKRAREVYNWVKGQIP
jgi:HEPN domain-containing protein